MTNQRPLALATILCVLLPLHASAQPDDMQVRMAAALRYTGADGVSPDDVARMTALWTRAQQPGVSGDERRLAFRDLYVLYGKLHGRDVSGRPQALDGLAQFAAATFEGGGRMDLSLPEPRGVPSGNYLHVETRGRGPTHLLLISDLGTDGRKLYASFIERHEATRRRADETTRRRADETTTPYTMHIVTLPFSGAARRLPWPERLDYASRPWLNQIERELLALVDQPRMKGVTIVGTAAGGYFAARLALQRPKQIRAVVLVSALVSVPQRAADNPDAPASLSERLARLKSVAAAPMFVPLAPVPPADELARLIADPKSMHPTARNWMAFAVKDTAVSRAWTFAALSDGFLAPSLEYQWELASTDLTEQLKDLSVPTLAMGTWHDEGSPVQTSPTVSHWEQMKLLYPWIPLTVVTFSDTRSYMTADAPEEFDRALADFLERRPVRGKSAYDQPRTSPRAEVMQSVGRAQIRIAYGTPAVRERKIWGALVPYGRVWRAGANEATTVAVDRDVSVEGRALSAGTYTFFVIPGESEWTLVFNRVPRQWGAFDYNAAFDALRITVAPKSTTRHEHLSYTIEPAGPDAAMVELAWENRAIPFRVESLK